MAGAGAMPGRIGAVSDNGPQDCPAWIADLTLPEIEGACLAVEIGARGAFDAVEARALEARAVALRGVPALRMRIRGCGDA